MSSMFTKMQLISINILSINLCKVELLFRKQDGRNKDSKRPNGVISTDFSISAFFVGIW